MVELEAALRRASNDLRELQVEFAVIGGLAVGIRGGLRTTQDVDFAVAAATDQEAEQVIYQLIQRGYETQSVLQRKSDGILATVRLRPPQVKTDVLVDILFASSSIESEVVHAAEHITLMNMTLPVARLPHLIAMKLVSQDVERRPTDIADIYALIDRAEPAQLDETRRLAQLIIDRGYHRDRDLLSDLERFIRIARERRESGEFF